MQLQNYIMSYGYSGFKRTKMDTKYDLANLILEGSVGILESDNEAVKEGNKIKILTLNKLLTRLSVLLTKMKTWNNSYKLKNKIRLILYLLYQRNKIIVTIYKNLIK